ncbi:MAG: protein kinase [Erysipelotrichia bacterium]|nr:protein kinase [Erysipelotrichia bacterium]
MIEEKIADRYLIKKLIGEGGMADVYLAYDVILQRNVAVKILRGDLANDPVNLARFQKEAMALANTSHPNIVEVFDVGVQGNKNYIVMEYVQGCTLKQLINKRGSIPIDETVNIMKQLVSAVAHAHKMGIIHRDIKSQNVLIKDDGTVKLSDFGIAYTADSSGLTQKETVMGSVHYIAPELAQGQSASVQSDIYSLGIVFYELLTGDVPYHGDSVMEIVLKHLHNDVPSVRTFNSEIPQSIENIVIKATARNKNLRYKSAMEMYNDICTCLDLTRNDEMKLNLQQQQEKQNLKMKKRKQGGIDILNILSIVAAVVLGITILTLLISLSGNNNSDDLIKIPEVKNYPLQQAKTVLENSGLVVVSVDYQSTEDVEKGLVISINPLAGSQVQKGTQVTLVVSLGKRYKVDNYVGLNIDEVKSKLEKDGFIVTVTTVEDSDKAAGTILFQSIEAGTFIEPTESKTIFFDVATYKSFLIPENIQGMNIEQAKNILEQMGAKVVFSQLKIEDNLDEKGNYIYPPNTVVKTSPNWNTYYVQTESSTITIYYY